jgi:hypothetical protein
MTAMRSWEPALVRNWWMNCTPGDGRAKADAVVVP